MKKTIINNVFFVFVLSLLFVGCSDEYKLGLTNADSVAPAAPVVKSVENDNGESTIFYEVPGDDDMLYVVATYQNNPTSIRSTKTSVYSNKVTVNGFGAAGEYSVELKSVDRAGNESAPVIVKVNPTTPPVISIFNSLKAVASWSGIRLSWENPTKANVIVTVMVKDENDEWVDYESIYSSTEEGIGSVRGLDAVEKEFQIYVRDRYDNFSEKLSFTATPWLEEKIDKSKFRTVTALPGDATLPWPISNIWDNKYYDSGDGFMHGNTANGGGIGRFATFDMGQKVKISRYVYFQRWHDNFIYAHNNMKEWVMYGTNELTTAMYSKSDVSAEVLGDRGPEYDAWVADQIEGWTEISHAKNYRPSGRETAGNFTQEDKEYAYKGDEHEVDLEVPSFRYIRILLVSNWSGGIIPQMGEIDFYGQGEKK